MELAIFAIFALTSLVSAILVVAHRNPVYSTMSLVLTLLSTAVLFVLLGSPLLAVLQILLYTGAILVLFLFVIMLFGALARLFWEAHGATVTPDLTAEFVASKGLAELLFSTYLLPFEIIGLLLLVAVVAASWVARRAEDEPEETR